MPGRIKRLTALTLSDWRLLIAASFAEVLVWVAVRTLPFGTARAAVSRLRPLARLALRAPQARVIWAIEASGRRLSSVSTCLVRAIVADLALGDSDRRLRLSIGIRRGPEGNLHGHAWIAEDGLVLTGGAAADEFSAVVDCETGCA